MSDQVRGAIEERLAALIRVRTVSAEVTASGPAAFEEVLAEHWPLVHAALEKEHVGELGLLYRWAGEDATGPLVLMAHYDVVPVGPDDPWTHDPFAGDIADGVVHGRGAIDDKGAMCTLLDAVENLLASGFAPRRDVYLSFGGDEETFGTSGKELADELHARGIRPWMVVDEGGAVIDAPLPMVDVPSAVVGVGEKGILSVRFTASGAAGHSSTPSSTASATDRVARAVTRVRRNPFAKRISPTTRDMLTRYRARATGVGKVLTTVVPALGPVSARVLARLGGEPAALVQTTVAATMLSGGTAENVMPSQASVTFNLRIALGETVAGTIARLRRAIGDPALTHEVISASEPSPASRTDNAQWALIEHAVEVAYPGTLTVPYVMLAASDARHFHPYTPEATYRFAPLAMSTQERAALHGVNESVTVEALVRGERFYRALIEAAAA